MSKQKRNGKPRVPCGEKTEPSGGAFHAFYAERFGGRWQALSAALASEEAKTPFSDSLCKAYYLSAASVAAALALEAGGGTDILDLCAAPGGKTLVLASAMGEGARLTSNEFSRTRRARLHRVLEEHLPPGKLQAVSVTGYDGARWSRYERSRFDRILLDAPCSSERHVMADASALALWSPARIRNLAVKQWALLSGAWLLLRPGGKLVYATCALSGQENGGVVEKLLGKYSDAELILPGRAFFSENPLLSGIVPEYSAHGIHILPDTSGGAGPIFFSVIRKKAAPPA